MKTKGIYVSPIGVEAHQTLFYHHFLQFIDSKKVICRYHFFDNENPLTRKYSDLVEYGNILGEGVYQYVDNRIVFHLNDEHKSLFDGTYINDDIAFKIKSSDYYLLSGTYTYIEHD